jgi:membrane fusion protein
MSSELALFRQEVVDFQQNTSQWGQVVLLEPVSTKILSWSLTATIVVIIGFLCIAQYARKETVTGYLTPIAGTSKIFAPQQGTIRTVHVKEGQLVQKGHPLITIDTAQIAANGQDANTTMLSTLVRQREMFTRQIKAEELRAISERDRLVALMRGMETEIAHVQAQIGTQAERIKLLKSFVSSAAQLNSKGYITDIEYKRRQQDVLEQEQNLNSLNQQLAVRQNQLTETRFTFEQLPTIMAEKIRILRNELASIDLRIAEANLRRAYVILAPAAGRVSVVRATVGQNVDPRRLQLEIVPTESNLRAELFIPARAIGLIEVGQKVRILYEAFPYQKYGTYTGQIVSLSETVVTSADITAPIELKEPAYKASVALDRPDVDVDDRRIPLQPDMLLRADVILEKRSIMAWLIDPLQSTRNVVEMEDLKHTLTEWGQWGMSLVHNITALIEAQLIRVQSLRRTSKTPEAQPSSGS